MFFSLGRWTRSDYNYTLLPSLRSSTEQRNETIGSSGIFGVIVTTTSLIKRRPRISVALLVVTLVCLAVSSYFICAIDRGPLPPTFEEYREYERTLPQNNESLPLPEGKDGMYLLIENYSTRRSPIEFCLLPPSDSSGRRWMGKFIRRINYARFPCLFIEEIVGISSTSGIRDY